ncbi:MAG: DUF904 domain-containing protein [Desulfobulbaceae bacterium]|nr:MAG: DUF904 domain-containing protein [Desulfobulbaceae bacterium]
MSHEENLSHLANMVNNLLGRLDAIASEKEKMTEQLRLVGMENAELRQDLIEMREEKSQVRQRVDGLIDFIEQWERNFAVRGTKQAVNANANVDADSTAPSPGA